MVEPRTVTAAWLVVGLLAGPPRGSAGQVAGSADDDPSAPWQQLADPAAAGWSVGKLAEARRLAERAGSAAVLAVERGRVVVAWGAVDVPLECHSVRKSLVSLLYGAHVQAGAIDLDTTLAQLDLDDEPPLTADEKRARVRDLLAGRSGIYHAAAKEPLDMKQERPQRGSAAPGERFSYNNWDFNGAGVVLARATGRAVGDEFEERFAIPLGFEDFERERDAFDVLEPCHSVHPAYAFRLSARDLARIGQLVIRRGTWNGEELVPASWIDESTRAKTTFEEGRGYGFMWWTYARGDPALAGAHPALDLYDKFAAIGTGGQLLLIVPAAQFVFVHRGDTDRGRHVGGGQVWKIAEAVFAARPESSAGDESSVAGGSTAPVELVPLTAIPFDEPVEPLPRREAARLDRAALGAFVGTYASPHVTVDVHLHGDRLFARTPAGEETELLAEADAPGRFFAQGANVTVAFERDATAAVTGALVSMFGREVRVERAAR